MNKVMFLLRKGLIIIILSIIFIPKLYAQEKQMSFAEKQQLKVKKLEDNVRRAEARVNNVKAKLDFADSLIITGKDMESEAIENIIALEKEGKEFTKIQNAEYKQLMRQQKRSTEEEKKEISKKIKELDSKYKAQITEIDKNLKTEYNKLQKALLNQEKGKEKQKQYSKTLENYIDQLTIAEKKLEDFKLQME